MRQVADGLHQLFKVLLAHFVQENGKEDRCGKAEEKVQAADNQRILHGAQKRPRMHQLLKVCHTHPWTIPDSLDNVVFFEGNHQSAHRRIGKNEIPDNDRQQYKVCGPKLLQSTFQTAVAIRLRFACRHKPRSILPVQR